VSCELMDSSLQVQVLRFLSGEDATRTPAKRYAGAQAGDDAPLASVDALCLVYRSTFPCSIVLSSWALAKYKLLFRHLFRVKYAQTRLHHAWLQVKGPLVHRMTHLLQTFAHYMFFEVIEPHWRAFWERAGKAGRVDEVIEAQEAMLDSCLRECLLTTPRLVAALGRLLTRCERFCASTHLAPDAADPGPQDADLQGFDSEMMEFIRELQRQAGLQSEPALAYLGQRLDWTGFYGGGI
jgi:gamma-tubulin complex component 2